MFTKTIFKNSTIAGFQDGSGTADFYVVYYASQRVGSTIHLPATCIAGSGMQIDSRDRKNINLANGTVLTFSRMKVSRGSEKQIVYYWFDQRGRKVTDQYLIKWYLLWDSITKGRTDGSMIRFTTTIVSNETEEQADTRIEAFLAQIYPILTDYLADVSTPFAPAPLVQQER